MRNGRSYASATPHTAAIRERRRPPGPHRRVAVPPRGERLMSETAGPGHPGPGLAVSLSGPRWRSGEVPVSSVRLLAIGFIYLCTAVAWSTLGASVVSRTGEFDSRLSKEVA